MLNNYNCTEMGARAGAGLAPWIWLCSSIVDPAGPRCRETSWCECHQDEQHSRKNLYLLTHCKIKMTAAVTMNI